MLGRISALLPSRDNDLVRLNVDAIGVVDFDQGTVAIDAVLVDSRLAHKFALTGAMALRARWGAGPGSTFVLAVGGCNPRFAPPADLPKLERIAIAFSSGNNPRLTCEAYFAITSNTVQFGARAQLYAAAYGFSVEGDVGFDVLLQIAPLHFIADFHAKVQLKHGSSNLFKVSVQGELEGPRPLRVSGKASFSIFWCDFTVRFDKTLVDGEKPPLPPAIDVLAELQQALASPASWSVQTRSAHGVSLRKLASNDALVLDPLGTILVRQQTVPLNTTRDIDLFGGAPVSGARRFHIGAALQAQSQNVAATRRPVRTGAVLRDDRRREARGAVVRGDGLRRRVRRRRRELRRSDRCAADLRFDRDRRRCRSRRAAIRAIRCRPIGLCCMRAAVRWRARRSGAPARRDSGSPTHRRPRVSYRCVFGSCRSTTARPRPSTRARRAGANIGQRSAG